MSKHSLPFRIFRVVAIIALVVFATFLTVAAVSGSLGGALLFVPAVLFGGLLVWLLVRPPNWSEKAKKGSIITLAVLFTLTGWYSFHIMFKFIQPTMLPKKVVPIGNPWVIEDNIFSDNDYNNPVVIQQDGTYWMYFHDQDNMMAASSADGKKFSEPTMLFKGEMPTVIKLADGRLRMYYFVNAEDPGQQQGPGPMMPCDDNCKPPKHNLVSAVSNDGLHWQQEPGVRLAASDSGYDRDTMIHPSVIQLGDGSYKLYYDGEVDPTSSLALVTHYRKILSASSKDGLTWTRDPGYRIDEKPVHTWEAYSPKALYEDGKVTLYFTTPNGIYQATSTDTMNFTISKNPVFSPGRIPMPGPEGALDSYQDSFVLPVEGGKRMYFWINGQGTWSAFQKD
jgi:F0F1-type ATP synthase assembly protein I